MIKRLFFSCLSILLGSVFGIYSAYFILIKSHNFKNYSRDGWYSNSPAMKELNNPYILAQANLKKQINLETNDDVILKTDIDENGDKLTANCIYKLMNLNLPCSFFTLYTIDQTNSNYAKLVQKTNTNLANLPYELNSQYLLKYYNKNLNNIILSPNTQIQGNNWLASPTYGNYSLVLTMHNLSFLRTEPSSFPLPKIKKISCQIYQ